MDTLEIILFFTAVIGVIGLGIWKSQPNGKGTDQDAAGYFLAGRGLTWWLVGFSLIAANISTEQFVGMSGASANWIGMAIASYEWMAAVTLVLVGFFFLPRFLKSGLYTIPEFLQYRFDGVARLAMAIPTIVTLVFVTTSSVIFSGAKFVSEYYNTVPYVNDLTFMCWTIAIFAAVYVFVGGLKACAWTDLIWGAALILGGALVMFFAFNTLASTPANELINTKVANSTATAEDLENANALRRFVLLNDGVDGEAEARNGDNAGIKGGRNAAGGKVHMIRPKEDSEIPWTALLIGLWIPNFFYWGLNQYIVQRTLGSKSLAEGQKGIVFAASLKLIIPFIVVIPGILAFNLFSSDLAASASAKNAERLDGIQPNQVVKVDPAWVEIQRQSKQAKTITRVLAINANKAQIEPPSLEFDKQTDLDIAIAINQLADQSIEASASLPKAQRISLGPVLNGYDYDSAFPVLVRNLLNDKPWLSWFVLAALFGAVISSLASMLNSASTIATMDLYAKFSKTQEQTKLVKVGRGFVILFVILAAIVAPKLDNFESIFSYIQEFQGFISPGLLAVFIFGFFSPRTPRFFGLIGILTNLIAYPSFKWLIGPWLTKNNWWYSNEMAFLDRMAVCFFIVVLVGIILTLIKPLSKPVNMPETQAIELTSSPGAKIGGALVIVATIALYIIFW